MQATQATSGRRTCDEVGITGRRTCDEVGITGKKREAPDDDDHCTTEGGKMAAPQRILKIVDRKTRKVLHSLKFEEIIRMPSLHMLVGREKMDLLPGNSSTRHFFESIIFRGSEDLVALADHGFSSWVYKMHTKETCSRFGQSVPPPGMFRHLLARYKELYIRGTCRTLARISGSIGICSAQLRDILGEGFEWVRISADIL